MRPGQQHIVNRVAHQVAQSRRQHVPRTRIIRPAPSAIAQVVEELIQAPPTADELRLLTEVAAATDEAEAERLGAQLEGTRVWELLRTLAQNDVRILMYVTVLLMIIALYSDRHPPQTAPPPAPQVTVNVTVPTPTLDVDEIVKQVQERIEREGHETPEPSGPDHTPR